jgi:Ni/Co efflux regulator RcnB
MAIRNSSILTLAATAVVAGVLAISPAAAHANQGLDGYKHGTGHHERVHYMHERGRHGSHGYKNHYRHKRHYNRHCDGHHYGHKPCYVHTPYRGHGYRSGHYYSPSYSGDGLDFIIRYYFRD